MKKLSKVLAMVLLSVTMIGAFAIFANAAIVKTRDYNGQFKDVSETSWYASSVKRCYELGLINGFGDSTYNPQGFFTLAEAVTVAARMRNLYNGGNGIMPPSNGAWYESAVEYCVKQGILSEDEYSDFTRYATREEMATIMVAALPEDEWTKKNDVSVIPDVENLGDKTSSAIYTLYNAGILAGSDEYGKFQPKAAITRAEVAALIVRMVDADKRIDVKLVPIAEKAAVTIPGQYVEVYKGGFVKFFDEGKYGIINAYGEIIVPAIYSAVGTLDGCNGFYAAKDGVCHAIDETGKIFFEAEHSFNKVAILDGGYMLVDNRFLYKGNTRIIEQYHTYAYTTDTLYVGYDYVSRSKYNYVIYDFSGNKVLNLEGISGAYVGENYIYVNGYSGTDSFYDLAGNLLCEYTNANYANANGLAVIYENGKYGIATPYGKVVDALYDSISLYGDFAVLKYANFYALASHSGIIFELCEYQNYEVYGDTVFAYGEDSLDVIDVTGDVVASIERAYKSEERTDFVIFNSYSGEKYAYLFASEEFYKVSGYAFEKDGKLYASDGGEIAEITYEEGQYFYKALNGKYGTYNYYNREKTSEAVYASPSAYIYKNVYSVTKENSKPIVQYGNAKTGYETCIQYYQKPFYYDSIVNMGYNGYFICTFNNISYILHA